MTGLTASSDYSWAFLPVASELAELPRRLSSGVPVLSFSSSDYVGPGRSSGGGPGRRRAPQQSWPAVQMTPPGRLLPSSAPVPHVARYPASRAGSPRRRPLLLIYRRPVPPWLRPTRSLPQPRPCALPRWGLARCAAALTFSGRGLFLPAGTCAGCYRLRRRLGGGRRRPALKTLHQRQRQGQGAESSALLSRRPPWLRPLRSGRHDGLRLVVPFLLAYRRAPGPRRPGLRLRGGTWLVLGLDYWRMRHRRRPSCWSTSAAALLRLRPCQDEPVWSTLTLTSVDAVLEH